jgi:hypothetical protein
MTSRRTRLASTTPQPAAFSAGSISSARVSASFMQCFYMKTAWRSMQWRGLADHDRNGLRGDLHFRLNLRSNSGPQHCQIMTCLHGQPELGLIAEEPAQAQCGFR